MRELHAFGSLGEFAVHLLERQAEVAVQLQEGLDEALKVIEHRAKESIGEYQPAVGGFPAWPELAESTQDDRVAKGYPADEPLLRDGTFRDSFGHERQGLEGEVGTPDERGPWFEFGTSKMPARPVLGPAAFLSLEAIQKLVGAATLAGLCGGDVIHEALGYTHSTDD